MQDKIHTNNFCETALFLLLCALGLQVLNFWCMSAMGLLSWSLAGTLLVLVLLTWSLRAAWLKAQDSDRSEVVNAWRHVMPWMVLVMLVLQMLMRSPAMSDSLCYRLPRIFLWLQEGRFDWFEVPDQRINNMGIVFEALALPFAIVNALPYARAINIGAWIVLYQLMWHWSRAGGASVARARWVALALVSAPCFLLQANGSANDFLAAVFLVVAVHMVLSFERSKNANCITSSLIALIVAAGVKPQFMLLCGAWAMWWLFSPSRPRLHTRWVHIICLVPVLVAVSPVPILWMNYQHQGMVTGTSQDNEMLIGPTHLKVLAGALQFAYAQLQLPIMPMAEEMNRIVSQSNFAQWLSAQVPKFAPTLVLVPIIDSASLGLVHIGVMVIGGVIALRHRSRAMIFLSASALIFFCVAAAKVVPGTIGRSFVGFLAMLLPVVAFYLVQLPKRALTLVVALAMGAGLTVCVLNPAAPMWPSGWAEDYAKDHGMEQLATKLDRYHLYQKRSVTGRGMLDSVPNGEAVAILVREFTPLLNLWMPDWRRHEIRFVHAVSPDDFLRSEYKWLLVAQNAQYQYPQAYQAYSQLPNWQPVQKQKFLPRLRSDEEEWILYRRN